MVFLSVFFLPKKIEPCHRFFSRFPGATGLRGFRNVNRKHHCRRTQFEIRLLRRGSLQPPDEIGGFLENCCRWPGIGAQGCALSNQMAIEGCSIEGSSKLPATIAKMLSVQAKSGEPHSPRNSRVMSRPSSVG